MIRVEQLCNLLFEFSHPDRLKLLHFLRRKTFNVTELSKVLGVTSQEASRHSARLIKTGLIEKHVDGQLLLTLFGELVLNQLQGIAFTSDHQSYFTDHIIQNLPPMFINRLSELASSKIVDDVMVVFTNIEKVIQEAEEYLWVITDQYLPSNIPLHLAAYERGVTERDIELRNWIIPQRIRESIPDEYVQGLDHARARIATGIFAITFR
jgi:predicted transcriptional regulator